MRYAVLSDVHANESALRQVLADARACGAETIVCLGDIVGYGPLPKETLATIRSVCSTVLAGNHDDAVSGRGDAESFIDLAGDAVVRHREALNTGELDWLRQLPYTAELDGASASHGDFFDPRKFYYVDDEQDAAANFAATDAPLMFVGHTHVPAIFLTGASGTVYRIPPQDFTLEDGKRYIVNPGSVGYPREANGECFSSYVLYDSSAHTVCFRRLPFSVASVLQRGTGPGQLRKRLFMALLAITAAIAGLGSFLLAPGTKVMTVAEDPALLLDQRTLPLDPDLKHVRANVTLAKGSDPILLRVTFRTPTGADAAVESMTVKKASTRAFSVPVQASAAEFRLLKIRAADQPEIVTFAPAASVR